MADVHLSSWPLVVVRLDDTAGTAKLAALLEAVTSALERPRPFGLLIACERWGFRAPGQTRTLDSHACRLRRKPEQVAGDPFLVNVWGVNYHLVNPIGAERAQAAEQELLRRGAA